ncbi:MAG: entericidin A/B family lipoprotein [Hyphomonadaceae bacterium]
MHAKLISSLLVTAAMAAAVALSACNTVQGAGEDVKAAGQAVSSSAEETKQDMQK